MKLAGSVAKAIKTSKNSPTLGTVGGRRSFKDAISASLFLLSGDRVSSLELSGDKLFVEWEGELLSVEGFCNFVGDKLVLTGEGSSSFSSKSSFKLMSLSVEVSRRMSEMSEPNLEWTSATKERQARAV